LGGIGALSTELRTAHAETRRLRLKLKLRGLVVPRGELWREPFPEGLIVDVEAGFFESEGGGTDHAGFVAEAGWKEAEVFFECRAELGTEVFLERIKKQGAGFGDAAADDDGFGIEEPAAVHESGGKFFGNAIPDTEGDFVALESEAGEVGGLTIGTRHCFSGIGVGFEGHVGDLLVADVVLERATIAIGSIGPLIIDGRLTEFSGDEIGAPNHAIVDDNAASHSGAEGERDEVAHTAAGTAFPLGVGHAISVVFNGDGKVGELVELAFEVDALPAFDVGEVMHHSGGEIDKARHADADGFDPGVARAKVFDRFVDALDERACFLKLLGIDPGGFFDEIAVIKDSGFHRSSAEINANGQRDVTHKVVGG
jgi:hypothetical protein